MATTVEGKHFSRRAETQLSLLDAEFPVSFKATEKRGETSVRLCVERRSPLSQLLLDFLE
jgi:hypothetical protein